ncbi:MAG: nuclear transport factor 2 family protein [Bacteroidetes bacterium]|nr:nuclear transport factor 2 family protein [Bacteroidota bacterium]
MVNDMMITEQNLLIQAYNAFNARDVDAALDTMHPDVDWPNGMEGGRVQGRGAVRNYWCRQWTIIDPHVEPVAFTADVNGQIIAEVHQVVPAQKRLTAKGAEGFLRGPWRPLL